MFFNKNRESINKMVDHDKNLKEIDNYINKLKNLTKEINKRENDICSIQEDYKKMFNLFPDMMILINDDGTVFDANKTASDIINPIIKEPIIGKKGRNILERCGIEGDKTIEKLFIDDGRTEEMSKEVYMESMEKHLILNVIPVIREQNKYFILICKNITDVKSREMELIKKQELLSSIDDISKVFSTNLNINYVLDKSVEILGRIDKVDSCYIYKNCIDNNHNMYAELLKEGESTYGKIYSNSIHSFYYKLQIPRGLEFFNLNHIVCGQYNDFPENEKMFLKEMGAKSICVVPVYTPLKLGGFLGLNSCRSNRKWTYDEEKLLKITANIIGAGIYQGNLRNNKEEIINKSCINF